jgi:methyl-accepting chemotaxis protein
MTSLFSFMRGFSIRTRMLGAIAIVLALLTMIGGVGLYGMSRMQQVNSHFADEITTGAAQLGELRSAMGDLRRYEKDMIIAYEHPDKVVSYRDKWRSTLAHALALIDGLEKLGGGTTPDMLGRLRTHVKAYAEATEPVIRQLEASGYDTATVANKMLGKAKEPIHASEGVLAELTLAVSTAAQAAKAEGEAASQQTRLLFGAALALAMLLVVPLTLVNMISICRPLDSARQLAQTIAGGDLGSRVDVQGRDETAQLQSALLAMQEALASVVGQVRSSAESISVASAEVATGNSDLSTRTEQTASSLQQTASSMEQLTGSVRQSAESARQARQLADSAADVAARGGSVVAQVVATMGEIDASSKKIAEIIGTIDGIAFQTNILALNAAVEAARAGEQGRGFAVVASEVRSLAQRSAEAAKQIKQLIGASVERVGTGSRQVQEAGSTMTQIVDSVRRVTQMIGEITTTATEQSEGIGQVNGAVTQLDQMTQQNAALVEESAAAAESLKEQARRLSDVIAVFRVGRPQVSPS